jgi:putative transposase
MAAVESRRAPLRVRASCVALGVAPATYYRHQRPTVLGPHPRRPSPARALTRTEQQTVLEVLHAPRFVDLAPAQVYATLLDEGTYHCAERTMYRVLAAHGEGRERRAQRRGPIYAAPELLATAPNQLWSWDITKLKGPAKWTYYYLYVLLDVFSRYVVGWMVAPRETAGLAQHLIATSCTRQGILPGQLTVHADRGAAMTSKPVALLLADLGVTKSHSRPSVSNDNPYSEAQFKTLKYRPDFPDRFGSLEHARVHGTDFFPWYNTEHRHSGLGLHTPHDVHFGLAEARRARRGLVLDAAFAARPDRFVRHAPVPAQLPTAAWINPPKLLVASEDVSQ